MKKSLFISCALVIGAMMLTSCDGATGNVSMSGTNIPKLIEQIVVTDIDVADKTITDKGYFKATEEQAEQLQVPYQAQYIYSYAKGATAFNYETAESYIIVNDEDSKAVQAIGAVRLSSDQVSDYTSDWFKYLDEQYENESLFMAYIFLDEESTEEENWERTYIGGTLYDGILEQVRLIDEERYNLLKSIHLTKQQFVQDIKAYEDEPYTIYVLEVNVKDMLKKTGRFAQVGSLHNYINMSSEDEDESPSDMIGYTVYEGSIEQYIDNLIGEDFMAPENLAPKKLANKLFLKK